MRKGLVVGWVSILSATADSETLEKTHAALNSAWAANSQIPADIRMQMSIAVGELMANVVEHGTRGRLAVAVELRMSVEADHVLVAIVDDGNETLADMNTVTGMPEYFAERGRGLPMAQSTLERLTYERLPGANKWLLTSRRFPPGLR